MAATYKEYSGLNLPALEKEILARWEQEQAFEKSVSLREGATPFVFYEGPPSANGLPGIHHVISRTLKDLVCRYKTMQGFQVKRKGGWDTHGLPVELQVEKELGITKEDIGKKITVEEYNRKCRETVLRYKDKWDDLTQKMGYWVDLKNPYITFENNYIESLWWILKQLYSKDLLYESVSIQPYSPAAGTGLSSHELNQPGTYKDVKDTSVVAMFRVAAPSISPNGGGNLEDRSKDETAVRFQSPPLGDLGGFHGFAPPPLGEAGWGPTFFLAWTTTPWTLPSNLGLTVGPKIEYVLVKTFNPYTALPCSVILAKALLHKYFPEHVDEWKEGDHEGLYEAIHQWINGGRAENVIEGNGELKAAFDTLVNKKKYLPYKIVTSFLGEELEGIRYEQLFSFEANQTDNPNAFQVMLGDFVTTEDGTGIVHTAPAFGADDYKVGKKYDIGMLTMVDRQGKFIDGLGEFSNRYVKNYKDDPAYVDVNVDICVTLKKNSQAFKVEKYEHSYPHCWRTDKPILYYPLDAWFIRTTALKDRMVALNKTINWKPASTGTGRFGNWLENMVDWNLSRSRFWGTPLPLWLTDDGEEEKCIGSKTELEQEMANAREILGDAAGSLTTIDDLHKPYVDEVILVSPTGKPMRRVPDLIDVWFDSGAMPYAQWHFPFENKEIFAQNYPADFIAEGVDQTRGWFYTLHAIGSLIKESVEEELKAPTYPPPTGEGNLEDRVEDLHEVTEQITKNHGSEASPVGGGLVGAFSVGRDLEGAEFYKEADPVLYGLLKEFAKTHRANSTQAEMVLWEHLKGKQLESYKFRRQHIIGAYITDFVCLAKKLVIEVDGLIHQLPNNVENDKARTEWLESKGYKVIRFTNDEVLSDIENTLGRIIETLQELPFAEKKFYGAPSISPNGGGNPEDRSMDMQAVTEQNLKNHGSQVPPLGGFRGAGLAYKTVVSNGLVLDKNGVKMSKRLGNIVDPFATIETFGADATRWYLITNASPWDNLKFDVEGIKEVQRKFFGTLYNTYQFFALYANVDGFSFSEAYIPVAERPEIDRWILSSLNTLVQDVTRYMDDYEPTAAGRAVEVFVDEHLSNWYVRLCRRRFWKGEYEHDKISAYQTLYECLETVVRLIAPIAPFFSDAVFANLNRVSGRDQSASVHHAPFPKVAAAVIDTALEERMQLAQDASSLLLSIRKKVNIKVRQPLQKVLIPVLSPGMKTQLQKIENLIKAEVNVKEIEYISDTEGFIKKKIKPNFIALGKKLGSKMKLVSIALAGFTQQDIATLEREGQIEISLNGEAFMLKADEVDIAAEDIPGWSVATNGVLTVALDITLTEELRQEGEARELVNRIQNIRKEKGLNLIDRIDVKLTANDGLQHSVNRFKNYICAEILADSLAWVAEIADGIPIEVNEHQLIVSLIKIEV